VKRYKVIIQATLRKPVWVDAEDVESAETEAHENFDWYAAEIGEKYDQDTIDIIEEEREKA
jgi:hypothetical protein|tara:strand:+ start:541 stop:723 length:183 start_codon:yes stop_codon:yes gene_type:complete